VGPQGLRGARKKGPLFGPTAGKRRGGGVCRRAAAEGRWCAAGMAPCVWAGQGRGRGRGRGEWGRVRRREGGRG